MEVQYLFLFQSILPPFWHEVREQSQCFFSLLSEEKRALAVLQGLNIHIEKMLFLDVTSQALVSGSEVSLPGTQDHSDELRSGWWASPHQSCHCGLPSSGRHRGAPGVLWVGSGPLWYSRKMGPAPATDPPGAGLSLITLHWGECSEERAAWALWTFLEPKVKQLRQMPSKR